MKLPSSFVTTFILFTIIGGILLATAPRSSNAKSILLKSLQLPPSSSSSSNDSDLSYYYAATTQHFPLNLTTPGLTISQKKAINLEAYESLTKSAASQNAQIIVFPESGTGYLAARDDQIRSWCEPLPPTGWKESRENCLQKQQNHFENEKYQHASWASCVAQKYSIDIVINFGFYDQIDGKYYNADAAFNKDGLFLVVYRKSHINAVPYLSQPTKADPVTFVSSFGVTFGLFTCFDLWFHNPQQFEIEKLNVTDFLYPNGMASMGPLMTIDAIHAGWSRAHQVNFISATMFPTGGAGIFHKGNVVEINDLVPYVSAISSVKVGKVPKINKNNINRWNQDCTSNTKLNSTISHGFNSQQQQKQVSCFHDAANCVPFSPSSSTSQTFYLSANYTAGPYATISCTATITTTSTTKHKWILAAGQVDLVPANNHTPDDFEAGFCVLAHCDDENYNCNPGAPIPSYWTSDLEISQFSVRATIIRNNNKNTIHESSVPAATIENVNHYPMYSFVDPSSNAIFPLSFPENVEEEVSVNCGNDDLEDDSSSSSWYEVNYVKSSGRSNNATTKYLYSAGMWLASKGN